MNVLAVGAHPDDVEFGCGGTLARHIEEGDTVTMVIMSCSTVQDAYTRDIMRDASTSVNEALTAARVLGIEPIIGPYQDTKIPFDGESVAFLEKVIKRENIDTIYTHWAGDSHQDHMATLEATIAAGRSVPNIFMYEQVPLPRVSIRNDFHINYYVNITKYMELKQAACEAHESQVKKFQERQGASIIESLIAQAKYRGSQCGYPFAEGFHILKTVR